MITTVTTTTNTVTVMMGGSLTLVVTLILIGLLIQKEVFSSIKGQRATQLGRALNIAIVPLLIVFAASVVMKVADVLMK